MPSRAASSAMASALRRKSKRSPSIVVSKGLAILCLLSAAPTFSAIAVLPRSGLRARRTASRIVAFGGFQQVLALPGPQARQFRIAADHQAFAWILQRGDRGHVPLVEQVELEGSGVEKR